MTDWGAPPEGDEWLWRYRSTVLRVIDGDSLVAELDHGGYIYRHWKIRLWGINAYEMNDPDPVKRDLAQQGKAYLEATVMGQQVRMRTYLDRTDKYGRLLGIVWTYTGQWLCVNKALVDAGLAVEATY